MDESLKNKWRTASEFFENLARMNDEAVELLEKARDPSFLERVCLDSTKRQELVKITERHGALAKELHQELHPPEVFRVSSNIPKIMKIWMTDCFHHISLAMGSERTSHIMELLEKMRDPSFLEGVYMDTTKRQELVKITERHGGLAKELHSPEDFQVSLKEFQERQELRLVHLKEQIDVVSSAVTSCACIELKDKLRAMSIRVQTKLDEKAEFFKDKDRTTNSADLEANHNSSSESDLTSKRKRRLRHVNRADLAANRDASSEAHLTTKRKRTRLD